MKPLPTLAEIAKHFPQFELLECLGRGGMGVVYKARQPKLNRIVALKILAPEKVAEPRFAERFQREAQALARLNHPNIVPVFDFGQADGLYYLLMEFVDGFSLRQLLQARKISPDVALAIVPKICEALQFAHEQGVVHRDIKPENVLLDYRGRVMIADFGIARIAGRIRTGNPLARPDGHPLPIRGGEGRGEGRGTYARPGPGHAALPGARAGGRSANGGPSRGHLFRGRRVLRNAHGRTAAEEIPTTLQESASGRAIGRGGFARVGARARTPLLAGWNALSCGKVCSANVVHFPEVCRGQPVVRAWSHKE